MLEEPLELQNFPQDHFSVTQLNTFLRCPAQYYFRYVEGLKIPPSGAITKGVCVHAGIEHNYKQKINSGKDLPLNDVTEFVASKFEEVAPETDWREENPAKAKDETIRLSKTYHKEFAPKIQPIASELEVVIPITPDVNLLGYIDVVDSQGYIRDTKTSSKMPGQETVEKSLQLSAYALAYRQKFNKEEKGVLLDYLVANKSDVNTKTFMAKRTERDLKRFKNIATNVISAIKNNAFYPNPTGYLCNPKWCGYYTLCHKIF
jgi:CRISPR/Cas system-associated exonuclease Cas4 (RecB family)